MKIAMLLKRTLKGSMLLKCNNDLVYSIIGNSNKIDEFRVARKFREIRFQEQKVPGPK